VAQLKVCQKHSEWTAEECANVSEKKLFVGMTREMVNAEKPRSCFLDKHPRDAGAVQFVCYAQWDRSEPEHLRRQTSNKLAFAFGSPTGLLCVFEPRRKEWV
jgi:hypothetical protein